MFDQVLECALNRPLYYGRRMRRAVAEACDVLPLKVGQTMVKATVKYWSNTGQTPFKTRVTLASFTGHSSAYVSGQITGQITGQIAGQIAGRSTLLNAGRGEAQESGGGGRRRPGGRAGPCLTSI